MKFLFSALLLTMSLTSEASSWKVITKVCKADSPETKKIFDRVEMAGMMFGQGTFQVIYKDGGRGSVLSATFQEDVLGSLRVEVLEGYPLILTVDLEGNGTLTKVSDSEMNYKFKCTK